ncbi:uncharacterized protein METZ01_LOCUS74995, partial [marine metagenome]
VADQQHRSGCRPVLLQPPGALLPEGPVAHGQCLVDQQDLGRKGSGDREVEPGPHARRVGLHR